MGDAPAGSGRRNVRHPAYPPRIEAKSKQAARAAFHHRATRILCRGPAAGRSFGTATAFPAGSETRASAGTLTTDMAGAALVSEGNGNASNP